MENLSISGILIQSVHWNWRVMRQVSLSFGRMKLFDNGVRVSKPCKDAMMRSGTWAFDIIKHCSVIPALMYGVKQIL